MRGGVVYSDLSKLVGDPGAGPPIFNLWTLPSTSDFSANVFVVDQLDDFGVGSLSQSASNPSLYSGVLTSDTGVDFHNIRNLGIEFEIMVRAGESMAGGGFRGVEVLPGDGFAWSIDATGDWNAAGN